MQPGNQNLQEQFFDKKESWLLIGIPSRDPFLVTQYLERHTESPDQHVKKFMPLRQGLRVMMQCYMRQLICLDSRYGQTGATCCERPTAYSISLLLGFIKDLGFRRIILKCDNEPSTPRCSDSRMCGSGSDSARTT